MNEVHEVAVKVFEGYVGQSGQDLLLNEISILRSCRNRNIVQFFGVAFQREDIWMLMELMEGNLSRHLARGHDCTWYFRYGRWSLCVCGGGSILLNELNKLACSYSTKGEDGDGGGKKEVGHLTWGHQYSQNSGSAGSS